MKFIYFIIGIIFISPTILFASEIRFYPHKLEVQTEEEFFVDIIVTNDKEPFNVIGGTIIFSDKFVSVSSVSDGNSSISFWIEKPKEIKPGTISFSGMVPGGLDGPENHLFTIKFKAEKVGVADFVFNEVVSFLNDGLGTTMPLAQKNIQIRIKKGSNATFIQSTKDTEAPEYFTPEIVRDSGIFDGKYFLVFSTQDKDSGVDHYEVREGNFGWFKKTESPYLLKNQNLDAKIFIKAVDRARNERVVMLEAKNTPKQNKIKLFGGIILLIVFMYGIYKNKKLL